MKAGWWCCFLVACAGGRPIGVYAEDARLAEGVRAAVAYWTGCGESVEVRDEVPVRYGTPDNGWAAMTVIDDWGAPVEVVVDGGLNLAGDEEDCAGRVYRSRIVTHEVGHVIGYHHVADVNAIMFPVMRACDPPPTTCP